MLPSDRDVETIERFLKKKKKKRKRLGGRIGKIRPSTFLL